MTGDISQSIEPVQTFKKSVLVDLGEASRDRVPLRWGFHLFLCFHDLVHFRPGSNDGGGTMSAIYIVSAIVAVGLLIYLTIALLKPEWF